MLPLQRNFRHPRPDRGSGFALFSRPGGGRVAAVRSEEKRKSSLAGYLPPRLLRDKEGPAGPGEDNPRQPEAFDPICLSRKGRFIYAMPFAEVIWPYHWKMLTRKGRSGALMDFVTEGAAQKFSDARSGPGMTIGETRYEESEKNRKNLQNNLVYKINYFIFAL